MSDKVGIYFWVRVGVMILTLVAVITLMYRLKSPDALLGTATPANSINLCPTRVSSISVIGRFALTQEGMSWFRLADGQRTELDPVAVEKWFSNHCTVEVQPVADAKDGAPLMTLAYVSGSPQTLLMNEDNIFSLGGLYFKSTQMIQLLTSLETLPTPKKPGQK